MKTIVAPTDFSPISLNAVRYAADMAITMNASLSLIHICLLPMAFSEVPYPAMNMAELASDAEQKMERLKDDISGGKAGKLKIYTEVRTGIVITEIKSFCDAVRPYAVVMGTQGTGAMERFLFGSNTIAAIKHLPWPLIIVPADAKFTNIKKIGLACDLKQVIQTSPVSEIKKYVREFGASLHVVHVNTEGDRIYGPEIIEESGYLQEMLDELHPSFDFLNNTGVEEGLNSNAERHELDLLIVIPKKHNLIDKLLHKSHTKKFALHTHVPVMAIHEAD